MKKGLYGASRDSPFFLENIERKLPKNFEIFHAVFSKNTL